jgi:site-specific recombinase XerD
MSIFAGKMQDNSGIMVLPYLLDGEPDWKDENMTTSGLATFTVTPFTRHSPDCPHKDNPQWKRCKCRKSLYIYENGKDKYVSAKTRSFEQAEKIAQAERDLRDPVKIELAKIEARKAAKDGTLEDALDQWVKGWADAGKATKSSYATIRRVMLDWAANEGIVNLSDITEDALDKWVKSWTESKNTKGFRISRVRAFFKWAHALRKIEENPTIVLGSIKRENEEETQPLTAAQFNELIEATYRYDADRRVDKDRFGADLRAIFLVQRWTGLRLSDVLMLPRSSVVGNRIATKMQKTGDSFGQIVPTVVIEALNAVPVRKTMHPDQFFWSRKCDHRTLAGMWTPRVRRMNEYINFKDEKTGEPLEFHSHMLRDTFAVELLLAGVPLEKVSKLLGHKSVRVTEKHYAPWVKKRIAQLEDEMMDAMRRMGATFGGDECSST